VVEPSHLKKICDSEIGSFPKFWGWKKNTPANKHSNGKPPFSIGVTSSKGGFPIAMLVYRSVPPRKPSPEVKQKNLPPQPLKPKEVAIISGVTISSMVKSPHYGYLRYIYIYINLPTDLP